ncbi:suppressor of stem-loop protein 1 [Cryptosporidium andersoni]|uniref:Suppressor of stem-loop protein 1 n=1 Tax=Cryptosporidium andersoni TaxID=117008 RepID=A0A1J4MQH3_9CRYT|nr:suppressor of stem-loop protein 1 [Cryptosporidium andersoni]
MDLVEKIADVYKRNERFESDTLLYTWEQGVNKTWEKLVETSSGLVLLDHELQGDQWNITKQELDDILKISRSLNNRRGFLRNIVIILDMSSSMLELDYKPDRLQCMVKCIDTFICNLLQENPLTQLSVISIRNGLTNMVTTYNSNYREIVSGILSEAKSGCSGVMSIRNGLEKAKQLLASIPPYGTKEIVFFLGSMRSIDSDSILNEWLDDFIAQNIVVNALLFIPELFIIKTITTKTGGMCLCALNSEHMLQLLLENFVKPPLYSQLNTPLHINLVPIGFPMYFNNSGYPLQCSCHKSITNNGYCCPRCKSLVCYLPIKCPICNLYLASANHLTKSFAFLFKPPSMEVLQLNPGEYKSDIPRHCKFCQNLFTSKTPYRNDSSFSLIKCTNCCSFLCIDCCKFILLALHQCPECFNSTKSLDNRI